MYLDEGGFLSGIIPVIDKLSPDFPDISCSCIYKNKDRFWKKNESFPPSYIAKNGVSRFLFYIDTCIYIHSWWVPYFSCWEGQNTRVCWGILYSNKVCNALVWVYDGSGWLGLVLGGGTRGQYLINLNLRLKVKINQVPGGTFLKRSGPLARIKIKGKSHGVWWTMHSFHFNEWSKSS